MRKEYTDEEFIFNLRERKLNSEKIKRSENLMLLMYNLLHAKHAPPSILDGVMYRMKKRYGEDTTFEQAVEWLDRDIIQAENEGN